MISTIARKYHLRPIRMPSGLKPLGELEVPRTLPVVIMHKERMVAVYLGAIK